MSRLRRSSVTLVVAAAAAVAGLTFALRPQHTPIAPVVPSAAPVDRPHAPAISRPTALVIADAYTSGSGLAETSYGCMAATRLGWLCKLAAEPGTGYVSGGTANRFDIDQGSGRSTSFAERLAALAGTYKPEVVILDGGRNDTFVPLDARVDVMASTIWQAHQTWPDARFVFVKPRFLDRPDDDLGISDEVINRVKSASGVQDLVVVDPIGSFRDTNITGLLTKDRVGPSRAGELALGSALAEALTQSGMAPAT